MRQQRHTRTFCVLSDTIWYFQMSKQRKAACVSSALKYSQVHATRQACSFHNILQDRVMSFFRGVAQSLPQLVGAFDCALAKYLIPSAKRVSIKIGSSKLRNLRLLFAPRLKR